MRVACGALYLCPSPTSAPTRSHLKQQQQRSRSHIAHSSLKDRILSDIKALGITPKRALGQNFVVSQQVIDSIVAAAQVQQGDAVVEVGPGLGSLTDALLSAETLPCYCSGAVVLAIEKDDALHRHLQHKFQEEDAVTLVHSDVLHIRDLPDRLAAFRATCPGCMRLKVVANIPYNITTDLMKMLLPLTATISSMHLLLEEGAARRLTEARVGDKDYRAVSVFTQYFATARSCFGVSRDLFYPAPHVDSALAEFVLRPHRGELDAAQEAQFLAFVTQAFGMKRKTLVNNLKGRWDQRALQECMESSAIPTMSRAESLSVQDFIELFKCVRALAPTTV